MSDHSEFFAPVLQLEECASTNAEAMRLTLAGEAGPFWVTSEKQTGGRGRQGRTWTSPPGNLSASLLIRLACEPITATQLSLVAGLALREAVAEQPGFERVAGNLRLKWPNDLLLGTAKCAGILVETSVIEARQLACVIGFGVNIKASPEGLDRAVTCLYDHGMVTDSSALLASLDATMGRRMGDWKLGLGFPVICAEWQRFAGTPGEAISVNASGTRFSGRYAGLDLDGALLLKEDGGTIRRIAFGEIVDALA
ncbi:biotin--[acetyl-CoA-carboxylase] ligase [Filomicrobium sp.]|uniref:biotin--[acetyl-CoA-carboxylase] ligase n=1 Tax=Filomicrobium sp. TaxID=2024831 RepID=UPI00258B987E|nr:biotin--[acetyl-CoA-carboxylase] ligase [Filomicrobium sp.]MCV0369410.1 biotin--[acetyl-CoA-carboxylase] ligase [Filomicrobium sp.]